MKGIVFTTDVIIGLSFAIIIILAFISVEFESTFPEKRYERLNYVADDILNLLSYLKVRSIQDRPTIQTLIQNGTLKDEDLNKTVLDLIGSFWYADNRTLAENITKEILEELYDDFCISLTTSNESIYSSCGINTQDIAVRAKIDSGYELGRPVSGHIARAFLSSIKRKTTSSYSYFGGYVGDGNLSIILTLPSFEAIEEAYMELDVGNNFTLYINGNSSGSYIKGIAGGGNLRSDKWTVCNTTFNPLYCSYFKTGNNTIGIYFNNITDNYVGGGYFKVKYNTSEMGSEQENIDTYIFPNINGFINLFSSFYIPGDLNKLDVHLHYKNNYTTYLTIGNTELYRNNDTNEQIVDITNTTLSSLLDYQNLSRKTIPIRLGTEAYFTAMRGNADVILLTDVSGSMNWRLDSSSTGTTRDCDNPNLYSPSTKRISLAKCLDKEFLDIILNATGNRVGLIAYSGKPNWIPSSNVQPIRSSHDLSSDQASLEDQIEDDYYPDGATGLCGAIRQARAMLEQQSNASRQKYIIVMTDGLANVQCDLVNEYNTIGCIPRFCPNTDYCTGGGCLYSQCGDYVSDRASEDAVNDSCRAYVSADAIIHTIGFGPVANCPLANTTLLDIANCGNGEYYASGNATELQEIYRNIAEEIVNITFTAQKIEVSGEAAMDNILYPDSFIQFNYTPIVIPYEYGEISLTRETERFKVFSGDDIDIPDKEGWFNVSEHIKIVDAKVTSYSSEFWTDRLYVKNSTEQWDRIYWLGDYGDIYIVLGDPFIVQLPVNYIDVGNNSVRIGTGTSPTNATGGSPDDRIIYSLRLKESVGYGGVFNSSEIALDDARQRLIDKVGDYVDFDLEDVDIESKSVSGIRWLWGPSLFNIMVWEK